MVRSVPPGGPAGRPAARSAALSAVAAAMGERGRQDAPLGALTTYRVGGTAGLLVEAERQQDLDDLRRALAGRPVPVLVLGRGSNLLVADRGFAGVVLRLGAAFECLDLAGPVPRGHPVVVRAGGALALPVLARRTVEAGLTGLEWAVGVPGSVGGAVRMNAGGHGSSTEASLTRFRWLDLAGRSGGDDGPGRLRFGYRSSALAASEVVIWGEFTLRGGPVAAGQASLREIVRWRRAHQPGGSNAGSVFANPPGDSAGRLVEAAGLKGHRLGTARVSSKHANFIQADEGGSADDVWRLMGRVRQEVARRFGVALRPEVRLIGFPTEETGPGDPAPAGAAGAGGDRGSGDPGGEDRPGTEAPGTEAGGTEAERA